MIDNNRRNILILIMVTSLLLSTLMFIFNIETGLKIAHYESPEGQLERALNNSVEREYNATLRIHNLRLLIGLFFLAVTLGSIGLYIAESRRNREIQMF